MIDLSFLTDEEQESILKVLQRDADLKKIEEERIRNLPEKVKNDAQVKNMSGQWFYEAKSKRHKEKIQGADIIRASIRRKPLTIAELSQSKLGNAKSSWVNNVNKEIFVSPEQLGVIQDKEEESKSNHSPKMSNTLQKPQEGTRKPALSPSKQRKNPFNDSSGPEDNAKIEYSENGMANSSETTEEENQRRANLPNYSRAEASAQPSVEFRQTGKLPVPKARKNVHKTSDASLQNKDSLSKASKRIKQVNSQGRPPKSILKRSSSSSSTDSEVLRLSQTLEPPNKSGLPTSTILEDVAEKSSPSGEDYSQNSLDRLKQVRFSSSVSKNERPPNLELHEGKELGEFNLLDTNSTKAGENEVNYLDSPSFPAKPARSYSPALDGNVKDGQESRDGKARSGSYSLNDSDLPSLVKSPPAEAAPPGEPSRQMGPSTMDNETLPSVTQPKTKQLNPEPCDATQGSTGQELRLAEAEEAELSNTGCADLKQGKPALVVGRSVDKHAAENLKAADESISKVLDWFKRSSSTADKETVLITPQQRQFTEEMDAPKSVKLSAIGEDKESNTELLNLKSSLYERGESTSKDSRLQDILKQPEQLSFSKSESPSEVVLGDQAPLNRSKENVNAASHNIHINKRTHFQTIDQREDKMDESNRKDICEDAFEDKTYMDLKNSDASFRSGMKRETSSQIYTDGERDVKSFLEEENSKLKSGETLKDPEGKDCNFQDTENMPHANNRSNLVLQQHELRQPSMIGDKKRVKDMKAFWEGGKVTPELGNKEVLTNENMSSNTQEYGRIKPVSGSSGYVTSESDNEQSKYNLVTFRKVELSEEESEMKGDDVTCSGMSRPIQGDKCTENQDINISNEVLSNDQKNANITGVLNESNLQPSYRVMASPKESERPKATALEKGALQPKSPFKIHSLKEKMDEESRSQMLNPSQFQNLRNFWDMGTKPQSKTDETIPQTHRSSSTGSYTKELQERIGSSQAILDDGRSGFSLQEEEMKKPTANISHQSPLAEAMFSPSATTIPMHLDYALTRDDDSSPVLPGKECAGIKKISPEIQHNKVVSSGFQPTTLVEEFRESSCPPIHDKGIPCVELVGKDQMAPNDQIQEPSFVPSGTNGKAGLKTSEVVEIVSRTLVPPKAAGADAFSTSLEKLLKETSDLQASLRHHIIMDVSEPADLTSEKRDFFNKVMERSHHSYPSDPEESREGSQTEGTVEKHHLLQTQPVEFTTSMGSLPRSLEELKPVPVKVPNKEDGQMYFSNNPAWEKNLLIPSLELIQPDTCGAAQNRTDSPEEDVLETVSKNNVPPNRECSDLNAKLIRLLEESATWPRTQDILETPFDDVPKENQQKSYQQMNEKKDFASLQTSSHLREAVGETAKESKDTNKDGRVLIVMQDGTMEVTKQYADPKERIQGELAGKQPVDTMETVVKTMKPKSYDPAAFRANLKQILDEDLTGLLGDIEIPKLTHSSLQPDQSVSSACAKDTWNSQEVIERVEKSTVSSNSRQVEFKARFQTLLKENPEILPCSQKITENSNGMQINKKSTENIGFISPQETDCGQEVNETANNISALPRFQPREFNSSLQKLLKEAAQTPPSQRLNLAQEETIMKSVVPAKEGQALKSNLEKLISEHLDPASRPPTVDCQKVTSDSTSDLDEQRSPVEMSRDYRSELKIPLTEKASKQTDEGAKLSEDMAFQKIIHLSLASSETPCLEKDKDFSSTADKAEDRSIQGKEAEFSTSLIDANRSLIVERGLQRSSTPLAGSPIQSGEVELYHAAPPAGDVDGDAKNCESDFSDENKSVLGSQRDPICSEEELNPVMKALKRNSNRQIPSKSVEDIPSATSNKEKINLAREDLVLSAEDVSTAPSFSDSQFSRPEKIKMMSKSVPAFLQDESDDRETDTASESSYLHGRITKSPSSLTNLSGSSGLASLSSVSTSVMSMYSGDFGNVDVKGNLQFAIDYVEQLKEFHIFIAQGKDLAIADMKRQRSDPYVKSYLLPEKHKLGKRKTSVKKKTLNPVYNEILRYKIDKAVLESQSLNVSVWHHDTFGRNSFLGEVELDLANWDWSDNQNKQMIWYPLKPRTPLKGLDLENRGEIKIALQYVPQPVGGKKTSATGEVHIWVKQCNDLPVLRGPKLNSFVKCTVLPDTSRKSRQKTRAVAKTTDPIFNHTMVYDGFRPKDLKEACVELTVWDHNKLANHFLGGLRIGLGTGKSYGVPVDWMDSTIDEANLWERMINSPNTWVEDTLPLRMLMVAKMTK